MTRKLIQMRSNSSFLKSVAIAIRGVVESCRNERNLKIQWAIATSVIIAGSLFHLSAIEWACITLCIGSVLTAETMNSAIESMVNLLSPEIREEARQAKDYAAGSVLLISITAVAVGAIIFGSHLFEWLRIQEQ